MRLLFVSGGIMMLGLIAVFASIVYKLNERSTADTAGFSAAAPAEGRIALPAGSRIVSTSLDGGRALITLEAADGATSLILLDLATGDILGRYAVGPE